MERLFGAMIPDAGEEIAENKLVLVLKRTKVEMEAYKDDKALHINADPLVWWCDNSARFPHLARLARVHMCIAATSVPSERVFSAAGNLVNAKRACLSSDNVDKLIFLNKNYKLF